MPWLLGVDEAGYGPNLGPFVMTSVACWLPDNHGTADLWQLLAEVVRKEEVAGDSRLAVDDSKRVYSPSRGLAVLERSVHACLGLPPNSLRQWLEALCPDDLGELASEAWFHGATSLPREPGADDFVALAEGFSRVCTEVGDLIWRVRAVVICPDRFNGLAEAADSKGAVLADGLGRLLRWNVDNLPGTDGITVVVDKHGGRNTYAAQLHHALPECVVLAHQESLARSHYVLMGLPRGVKVTFQPRADGEHFCVALASMTSKYLREVLMHEFNSFWADRVPGLKPTAGYPGDASRFLEAIRPALEKMGLGEERIWRKR